MLHTFKSVETPSLYPPVKVFTAELLLFQQHLAIFKCKILLDFFGQKDAKKVQKCLTLLEYLPLHFRAILEL